ncbi:FH1/FH2 domain-containing protein 3 [Galemys pyrenaicus]|uniref:FH1/FH2 domain-containing protein 3 n=1 Tax=Galemys pyrenaicus TaxID=202257 RepID=A0A8J6ANG8_GALPY|nr:FH1/FH2 domain-containing protein 3 [Galemys pyrenaicus]
MGFPKAGRGGSAAAAFLGKGLSSQIGEKLRGGPDIPVSVPPTLHPPSSELRGVQRARAARQALAPAGAACRAPAPPPRRPVPLSRSPRRLAWVWQPGRAQGGRSGGGAGKAGKKGARGPAPDPPPRGRSPGCSRAAGACEPASQEPRAPARASRARSDPASPPAAPLIPGPAPPRQGCIMATLACRVQFLDDTDPFNSTNFPEPSRPPLFTFREDLALGTQLAGVHRLLRAPHKVRSGGALRAGAPGQAGLGTARGQAPRGRPRSAFGRGVSGAPPPRGESPGQREGCPGLGPGAGCGRGRAGAAFCPRRDGEGSRAPRR